MPESFKRFSTVFSSGWICILASLGRNKVIGGAEKLQLQHRLLSDDGQWFRLRFQSLFQNELLAVDVQQIEVQVPPASSRQPSGCLAMGQAPHQLRTAQTATGKLRGLEFT